MNPYIIRLTAEHQPVYFCSLFASDLLQAEQNALVHVQTEKPGMFYVVDTINSECLRFTEAA